MFIYVNVYYMVVVYELINVVIMCILVQGDGLLM